MFKNAYHGGAAVEIFTTAGKEPLKNFKIEGGSKNVQKVFEKLMKCSIYNIEGPQTKIQIPPSEKETLGLIQPFLVFQIYIPSTAKNLKIEIAVTDAEKIKRRLIFHTGAGKIVTNPLHARIPVTQFKRDIWLNLSIDVFAFAHYCFKGINVKSIDLINLTSDCKIRRIFTMKQPLYDSDIDTNPSLQEALDKLTMDEFGGDSSQIMFEHVPKNLDFAINSIQYQNQFIFPHRIEMAQNPSAAEKPTVKKSESKQKVAFGRVLPQDAPNLRKNPSQASKRPQNGPSALKANPSTQSLEKKSGNTRQVKFQTCSDDEEDELRVVGQKDFGETREDTFGADDPSIIPERLDPEEELKIEKELPGSRFGDKYSPASDGTTQMSDFKIDPTIPKKEAIARRSIGASGNSGASSKQRELINFNLHEDDEEPSLEDVMAQYRQNPDIIDKKLPRYENCFISNDFIQKQKDQIQAAVPGSLRQKALERKLKQHEDAAKIIFEREKSNVVTETPDFQEVQPFKVEESVAEESIKEDVLEQSKQSKIIEQSIHEEIQPEWIENKFDEFINQNEKDRFTSIKKSRAQNIVKHNKFSSSGVGNFQGVSNGFVQNSANLPPMSPTPTTNQFVCSKGINKVRTSLTGTNNFISDDATEMIEHTGGPNFIEYDLGLNNQDQYNSASDEEEKIPEDIVTASIQSADDKGKQIQENLRAKMQAKKEEKFRTTQQESQKFGTQIVNYQPGIGEGSEESMAKRTFSNMGGAEGKFPCNEKKTVVFNNEQKENENSTNAHFFNRAKVNQDITDPNIILDSESDPSISHESHDYARLKSTRQQTTFKTKNVNRGFSPPVKLGAKNEKIENLEITVQMEDPPVTQGAPTENLDVTVQMEDDQVILSPEDHSHHLENTALKLPIPLIDQSEQDIEETQILRPDIGAFTKLDKSQQDKSDIKKLMRVEKVDILRDSLDEEDFAMQSQDNELANQIKSGQMPKQTFCMVEKTGELIDLEFVDKFYYNASTKEYYRPIIE